MRPPFHFFDGLSAVLPGEFEHEIAEGFEAFGWHGVVDRGPAAADGAVALQSNCLVRLF